MIQEIKPLIRNNASDEYLIAVVFKESAKKERNLVQGKHHKKALRVYESVAHVINEV